MDAIRTIRQVVKPWASQQICAVLRTLKKPTMAEASALLKAARENGGIVFLYEVYETVIFCAH